MSRQTKKDKYIDFRINGRLFPTWMMANFKKYKLPEIIIKEGEDPCATSKVKFELRKYQVFASAYLDYKSPYQNILIYHGLGSGKTLSAINVYNMLYNYTPGWNVFILIKATLKDHPWMSDLDKLLRNNPEKEFMMKNIKFISYDSPLADRQFMEAVRNSDSTKKNLYMFDETHNFISNVYSNVTTKKGRRAQTIYDYIIQDKTENEGVRVVLLSGTPAINKAYEIGLLFNLLRPNSFPKSESEFNKLYVTDSEFPVINPLNKNLFQRRIMGLVSYYVGSTIDLYPTKVMHYVDVPMSDYQTDIYNYYEEIEDLVAMKKTSSSDTLYKTYTRQACNFVFPAINQRVTGETRPRPNRFKISDEDAEKLQSGKKNKNIEEKAELKMNLERYKKALDDFINSFDEFLSDKQELDNKKNYTIFDDIELCKKKYNNDFIEFLKSDENKSNLFNAMSMCSNKFLYIIFNLFKSKGPVLVYTNYVIMEGIQIFKIYLKYFGFTNFEKNKDGLVGKDYFRYTEYHGGISKELRTEAINNFNNKKNVDGQICKVIMISSAGAEGLSLYNLRQVHITEPNWQETKITQVIGRAFRACFHADLPMKERIVDVYRYKSTRKNNKITTDQHIENSARTKQGLIESFYNTIKEVAVDCNLFRAHNMMEGEYKCFQFDEPSLFDKYIGPAFKDDIQDDMRIGNGSNSINSQLVKIRVKKIKAVKQLTNNNEEKQLYSKPDNYWYYPDSNVVYDFEFKYAIGKVAIDEDQIPQKLDKDTYIIDQIIPIPYIDGE